MNRFILIAALFIVACNSSENSATASKDSAANTAKDNPSMATTPISLEGCYAYAINKDTATMELVVKGNNVSGNLKYDWAQKDRNIGTVEGVVKDSLIVANYTFQSEGTTSVRQVVFKINGNELTEGFGPVNTSGDTTMFSDIAKLQFQNDRTFKKVECTL
jgi:hypothetical protein